MRSLRTRSSIPGRRCWPPHWTRALAASKSSAWCRRCCPGREVLRRGRQHDIEYGTPDRLPEQDRRRGLKRALESWWWMRASARKCRIIARRARLRGLDRRPNDSRPPSIRSARDAHGEAAGSGARDWNPSPIRFRRIRWVGVSQLQPNRNRAESVAESGTSSPSRGWPRRSPVRSKVPGVRRTEASNAMSTGSSRVQSGA